MDEILNIDFEKLQSDILELLANKKYSAIRNIFLEMNPADIAEIMNELPLSNLPVLYRLLPKELAADTFVEMDSDVQTHLISSFSDTELHDILDEIYLDDTVDIIEEMPANVVKRILANSDADTRAMINKILQYPEDSAGSIMTVEYVSLRKNMTVDEAINRIRRTGIDKETIYTCYVTDYHRTLLGVVTAKDLLLSESDKLIEDIMETNVISVHTHTDKEDVAQMFSRYDFMVIPVVDDEDRLVGIVTVDDAIDVIEEEATEDIEKMAAINPSDKPYLQASVWETFLHRIPWLLLLMISAIFTSIIITGFEDALSSTIILSACMPMLMDTGGNCGGQASVTIIRALSLGDVVFKDIFKIIWKELRVGVLCGIVLAVVNFIKMMIQYPDAGFSVKIVVSLSLFLAIVVAKLIGCVLPLLADKIGFDPAVMSSPFITTIVDALSLLIYFALAVVIMHIPVT
ncbi:MAG: magnesium transporter [Lachnospiraceae bacterium]|nr:magnesium transporter [Lachnospiraceae bacterium]